MCRSRYQPLRSRLTDAHRHVEDRRAQASARHPQVRRRLRWRSARRGAIASEGTHLLDAVGTAPVGPEATKAGAVARLQPAARSRRERARFPAVELDRARRVAVHRTRAHTDRPAVLRGRASRCRARRPLDHGRRRPHAARRRRGPGDEEGSIPTARVLSAHGGGRERSRHADRHHPRDAADDHIRATGTRHRLRCLGIDGEEEARRVLLMVDVHHAAGSLVEEHLDRWEQTSLLRFITCGSVDDGKSTLIGRLLYDSHLVFEDHLSAVQADSKRFGRAGGELDLSLLVDGLAAEREQGITIDVAYRYFATDRRKFIVADTPGHEQYTRNMVTGASNAELAVILVDATKGLVDQTRRHSYLVSLIGIRDVVLAVNKMDLVDFSQQTFDSISEKHRAFAATLGLGEVTCIPVSALRGDNVTRPSDRTPWYDGPPLLEHLETVTIEEAADGPFRMPVQWVNRPNAHFRGFSGTVVGGSVRPGDSVRVVPSGTTTKVKRISTFDGDRAEAITGQSSTVVLADEVDVSRGSVLCSTTDPAEVADQFEAHIVWMHEAPMQPRRQYLLKTGAVTAGVTIDPPKYKVDVATQEHLAAQTLTLNEIGVCTISTSPAIPFDAYVDNRDLGGFVVIDRTTNATVGAGLIHF